MSFYNFPHHWLLGKQIDSLFWIMQSKLKINRFKKYNMVFKKGGNWCSLTNEAVTYLLKNKKVIFKMCKLTCCADECYKQCLLYNQEYFRERIYIDENGKTGKPFVLPQEDPDFYSRFMFSYNIPEFVKGKVEAEVHTIADTARKPGNRIRMGE